MTTMLPTCSDRPVIPTGLPRTRVHSSAVVYAASAGLFVLPVVALCVAYIVAIRDHQVEYPYFHPSVAIDYGFPRVLASFVFGLSLPLLIIFAIARYAAYDLRTQRLAPPVPVVEDRADLSGSESSWKMSSLRWSNWSLALGCVAGLSMVGIACVPYHVSETWHLTFAFLFFTAGLGDVAVQLLFLDPASTRQLLSQRRRCIRQVLGASLAVSFIAVLGSQYMLNTQHWAFAPWVGASELAFILFLFIFWATELPTIFQLRFTMEVALGRAVVSPRSLAIYESIDLQLPTAQRQRSPETSARGIELTATTLGRILSPLSPLS